MSCPIRAFFATIMVHAAVALMQINYKNDLILKEFLLKGTYTFDGKFEFILFRKISPVIGKGY